MLRSWEKAEGRRQQEAFAGWCPQAREAGLEEDEGRRNNRGSYLLALSQNQGKKPADRCCIIHHLLRFYVDKVFKHCETEDSHVNRKISSIANSFLSIKKKFRQCIEQNMCGCGEEAIEKYKQILTNYGQLNTASAAMKSLGELDILLDWMEKAH
ncbi:interleukin-20-like isoform X1 [Mauremys reevesii]|uniref:interleukin-20-like isoform X1 n=1 Tax=Mauremys reevesii TaxID=260615 RepID=UPI00193FF256|nr:interleukin-20-like isoform X1 [Mauremys reevesii]